MPRHTPVVLACLTAACGDSSDTADAGPDAGPRLAPELGTGDHSAESVTLTVIADDDDDLTQPRDLAFNPRRPDELWVVNHDRDSTVIVHDASTDDRTTELRIDGYALHFMAEPSAIAFGADETTIGLPGTFATCGESRNTYDDMADPNDFMGPTLWSSDFSVYAAQNPNGLGSHLDMLHCSPLCMGIAHERDNVYWTFGGLSSSIVRYDFQTDDGIGNDNHTDGTAYRWVTGEVEYAPGVPSHLVFDPTDAMLYVADTGNGRVARLDTTSGEAGAGLAPFEPMQDYRVWDGATLVDVVPASSELVQAPSGIELRGEHLYVSDNATGRISAFTRNGELVNWLDTGLPDGALAGMAFGPDGKLYFVDMIGDRVLRIDP